MDPISQTLVRVSIATKKKIPDDDTRLKMIKQGLITIGNHINSQVRDNGYEGLADKMWQYVSDYHWPQSKHSDQKVSGQKLRDMHKKIAGKDAAAAAAAASAKDTPSKSKPLTSDKSATNGTMSTEAKREPSPSGERKLSDIPTVKKETADVQRTNDVKTETPEKVTTDVKMTTPESVPAKEVKMEAEDVKAEK